MFLFLKPSIWRIVDNCTLLTVIIVVEYSSLVNYQAVGDKAPSFLHKIKVSGQFYISGPHYPVTYWAGGPKGVKIFIIL